MKTICLHIVVVFTMLCFGDNFSSYEMLTNKLSLGVADSSWRYETNGILRIKKIVLSVKIDKKFSDEIIESLRKCCSNERNDAILSSGNSDNPNILQLQQYFDSAVLHTPTIIKFQTFAKEKFGKDVTLIVHHEKLSYVAMDVEKAEKNNRIIRCFLWVELNVPCDHLDYCMCDYSDLNKRVDIAVSDIYLPGEMIRKDMLAFTENGVN